MVGELVDSEAPRERQRFSENKVYTRKLFKGIKKNSENATSVASAASSDIQLPQKDTIASEGNCVVHRDSSESILENNGSSTANDGHSSVPVELVCRNGKYESKNNMFVHEGEENHFISKGTCNMENFVQRKEPQPGAISYKKSPVQLAPPAQEMTGVIQSEMAIDTNLTEEPFSAAKSHPNLNVGAEDAVKQVPSMLAAPSDGSGSHMQQEEIASWVVNEKVNCGIKTKQDRIELRRKLESELVMARNMIKRIEAKQGELKHGGLRGLQLPKKNNIDGIRCVNSDVGPASIQRQTSTPILAPTLRQSRPTSHLRVNISENVRGVVEGLEKEKRTPKANQFYRNSEFLLAKDKFPPADSNKKMKANGKKKGSESDSGFGPNTKVFKSCSALLERLMKHKHGWVFNSPVDVDGLRLHDYYNIIKYPMDLGTIKARLIKNWYKAPEEFAEDVRLTFSNAMTYNPKGQDVHVMAEQLLDIFEEKWATVRLEYDWELRFSTMYNMGFSTPQARKPPPPFPVAPPDTRRILSRSQSMAYPSSVVRPKLVSTPSGRTPAPKKPKARDPNKRDMTYEEKQKLSTNLQSMPAEKLENIVQIIRKRNSTLAQNDEEIEVDIDSVDAETLWELERFVTNYKKNLSKNKRKAELAMQARAAVQKNAQEEPNPMVVVAPKDTNTDSRIDTTTGHPQEEKQEDHIKTSSSSSSSSDSGSSSSDSDSDSSSASGSDVGH